MPVRYTSDANSIAKAIKGIEGELANLKADVRGRDDPVTVARQSTIAVETFVHGVEVRVYNASDLTGDNWERDWTDLGRAEKRWRTFDVSATQSFTRDVKTTTNAFHDWTAAALGRDGGPQPGTRIHVGDGDPEVHEPAQTTLSSDSGSVPVSDGIYRSDSRVAELSTCVDYDELTGTDITEIGLETAVTDEMVGLAGFTETEYTKASDEVITIDFQIGARDADLDGPATNGVATLGFADRVGDLMHPAGLDRDPILTASIGTAADPEPVENTIDIGQPVAEVPVTDTDLLDGGIVAEDAPRQLAIVAYIDASIATGEELTEIGLIAGTDEGADEAQLVTWSVIDPSVERTAHETLSVETTIELYHASR